MFENEDDQAAHYSSLFRVSFILLLFSTYLFYKTIIFLFKKILNCLIDLIFIDPTKLKSAALYL